MKTSQVLEQHPPVSLATPPHDRSPDTTGTPTATGASLVELARCFLHLGATGFGSLPRAFGRHRERADPYSTWTFPGREPSHDPDAHHSVNRDNAVTALPNDVRIDAMQMTRGVRFRITARARLSRMFVAAMTVWSLTASAIAGGPSVETLPKFHVLKRISQRFGTFAATWSSDGTMLAAYSLNGNIITIWNTEGQVIRKLYTPGAFYLGNVLAFVDNNRAIVARPADYLSNDLAMSVFGIFSGKIVRDIPGPIPGQPRRVNIANVLAESPDQSMLAIIYGPARALPVALYSTRSWARVAVLKDSVHGPLDPASSLAFSSDGQRLAVGRADGRVLIYDVATRRIVQIIDAFGDVEGTQAVKVAFNPDGTMIGVGAGLSTMGWWYADGRRAPPNHGRFVLMRPADPVRVFRVKDGVRVASDTGHLEPIRSLAWSPSGQFIAFIAGDDTLHLWNPLHPSGGDRVIKPGGAAVTVAFSPDGSRLAVCAGEYLTVFGVGSQRK